MALQGTDIGALKSALREILVTDRAHPDTFNPILQDLINNDVTLEALSKSYTDQQIQLVTESGVPKLVSYQYVMESDSEGKTNFDIPLQTFDKNTDTVIVSQNRTYLENTAYSINETNQVVLVEPVSLGTQIHIMILKNVPQGPEGSINGGTLAINSIPINRLQDFDATKIEVLDLNGDFTGLTVESVLLEINNKTKTLENKTKELENLYWMGAI